MIGGPRVLSSYAAAGGGNNRRRAAQPSVRMIAPSGTEAGIPAVCPGKERRGMMPAERQAAESTRTLRNERAR